MHSHRVDAIAVLAAVGCLVAGYLSFEALFRDGAVACGPLGDCHAVQSSGYAKVAGVPVAVLGLLMYAALLALAISRRLGMDRSGLLRTWAFALALGGVLYSAYLTYVELFVVHAVCAWCVTSAVIVAAILITSLPDARPTTGRG